MGTYSDCMAVKATFALRLKQARKLRGYTQAELGKLAGLRQSAIGNLEAGINRGTENILELSKALGVRPEWLQDGIGPREEEPLNLRPEVIEIAKKIEALPVDKLSVIRNLVDALGPAVSDERVSQFIKPAGK